MSSVRTIAERKLRVFISYSRRDEDFAQELLVGLQLQGFEPYLDKHDIAAGEAWETRLGRLIESADTVVFVISPDAVASQRCAWEVEQAVALNKRLLPIVWKRVDEALVPTRLKQLNYIFFDRPLMSVPALTALSTALTSDLDWIREHTRIGEEALRWDSRGRSEAMLFRGDELIAAQAWLDSVPRYATGPTLVHYQFIKAGQDAQAAREGAERKTIEGMRAALEREMAAQTERELALRRERLTLDRMRRAQTAIAALLFCIIVMGIGWSSQELVIAQYQWRFRMGPSALTAAQEREKASQPGSSFSECKSGCPTMIVLPSGKFIMGSPDGEKDRSVDEGPQREIAIAKPFAVGRTEVTFAEYDACVASAACEEPHDSGFGRGDRPVINVSWSDAKTYAAWLSRMTGKPYRLLTEAEWEYAARAGGAGRWSFGDEDAALGEHAWILANAGGKTQPVGKKKPNAFGLYDVHGGVYEWVEDCYGPYQLSATDGAIAVEQPGCASRVIRGGAWHREPRLVRVADRDAVPAGGRRNVLGIRLARTLSPAP